MGKSRMINPTRAIPQIQIDLECRIDFISRPPHSHFLVCPLYAIRDAEAVGPSILQSQDNSNRENDDEPPQSPVLSQVHKIQKGESGFHDRHAHHAFQHLSWTNVLISDQ